MGRARAPPSMLTLTLTVWAWFQLLEVKVSEAGDTVTPDQVLETATVTSAAGWAASCRPTLVLPTRVVMSHSWTVAVRAFLVSAREYTRLVVPLDACCVMAPDVAVRLSTICFKARMSISVCRAR